MQIGGEYFIGHDSRRTRKQILTSTSELFLNDGQIGAKVSVVLWGPPQSGMNRARIPHCVSARMVIILRPEANVPSSQQQVVSPMGVSRKRAFFDSRMLQRAR
jgi:hypothetical protein